MNTNKSAGWNGSNHDGQKLPARDADMRVTIEAAKQLEERLEDEGRLMDAGTVRATHRHLEDVAQLLDDERLATASAKPKSDRQRASGSLATKATGGIGYSSPPEAPPHKHQYAADGHCIKVSGGRVCGIKRQRQRKAQQTVIPGVDAGVES